MDRKTASKQVITSYQAFTLLYSTIFGAGVLSLPRSVGESAGNDMIWVILLSGVVVAILVYLMTRLCQRFPGMTLVQFAPYILGSRKRKWVGYVISFPFLLMVALFFVMGTASVVRIFGETVVTTMLPRTPVEAVMLIFLLAAAFGAGSDLGVIAKLNEFLFPITLIPFLSMIYALFQSGEITNILPLFQLDPMVLPKALMGGAFAFAGFQVVMIFSGFYQQPEKMKKANMISILAITISYWYLCAISLSVFGIDEVKNLMFPVLEVAKVVKMEDILFERIESAILSIWLVAGYTSVVNLFSALVQIIIEYFRLSERYRRWIAFLAVPVFLYLALIPENTQEVGIYADRIGLYDGVISVIIPVVLLLVAVIRKKKGEVRDEI
ncbi:endospore germination permease [Thermoactinomyces vulgaris]|jgi:spore germination protein|uniref:Endospore germination permease n=1 Tax=Thermoactinomyces vulgaris TaxID=2026 RepID=A0ABS0QHN2_THEVU|nr:endospore germination permease [Thermoactinomyces vulgaris]MBA4551626.1 endospore germination permease [Thermoactinomyces vulgaris]MBA4596495.1 endospore germination permease [Thermoactinomyces vulgaris]MBH8588796.1 endospore germination permease [Thermoactinomyces vulgaris]RMB02528.1 spore germination protein (amino acid permease) [Thermoactinomyces vulgaris]